MPCLFGLYAAETVIRYLLKKENSLHTQSQISDIS
jgi:hypothetical protein